MSQMNIINVTTIYGRTNCMDVTTTPTTLVSNPAASNSVYKINNIIISNKSGTGSATITVEIVNSESAAFIMAHEISLPENTTYTPTDKSLVLYLNENESIRITAGTNGFLQAICSYEVIS